MIIKYLLLLTVQLLTTHDTFYSQRAFRLYKIYKDNYILMIVLVLSIYKIYISCQDLH